MTRFWLTAPAGMAPTAKLISASATHAPKRKRAAPTNFLPWLRRGPSGHDPRGIVTRGQADYLAFCLAPVVSHADLHCQWWIERVRAAHLLADELLHGADLCLRNLQQQLVVNL